MKRAAILALLAAAACADYPRDPDGTLERIRASREFSVGILSEPAALDAGDEARALIARVERRAGARARLETGDPAALLARLEAGELDLVLGGFLEDSPWATRVTFSSPLGKARDANGERHYLAAMPNGENAWIMLVESEAHALAAPGA